MKLIMLDLPSRFRQHPVIALFENKNVEFIAQVYMKEDYCDETINKYTAN